MLTEIIVLSVLVVMIIMAIILSKRNVNIEEETEEKVEIEKVSEPVIYAKENNDEELIAILTAAVMAYSKNNSTLIVKSFRKVGDNAPAWNRISRAFNA